MGRHSAGNEEVDPADTAAEEAGATTLDLALRGGRHASTDDGERGEARVDEAHTERIAPVSAEVDPPVTADTDQLPEVLTALQAPDDDLAADQETEHESQREAERQAKRAAKQARRAERAAAKRSQGESDTRADLRLLRHNSAVRAQAIAAVVVMFLLYTVVMVVIGKTPDYLQWLFVPIVAAGVSVGVVLDLAHRRADKA